MSQKKGKYGVKKITKISSYMKILRDEGLGIGEPYIKHIEGKIWELRPKDDRIFFVAFENNNFLLLHFFAKKTNKTPPQEIEQAKRNLADIEEREVNSDELDEYTF